jgi:cysteinyl-tRNA synthetase
VFGDEGLEEAGQALNAFYRLIQRFDRITGEAFYPQVGKSGEVEELTFAKSRADGDAMLADAGNEGLLAEIARLRSSFLEKMDDDFNTGGAVSDLFEMSRALNRFVDQNFLEDAKKRTAENIDTWRTGMRVLRELGAILGLFVKAPKKVGGGDAQLIDGLMGLLIELRANARKNKDFATSDVIRNGLLKHNITLQDLKEGTTWEKS